MKINSSMKKNKHIDQRKKNIAHETLGQTKSDFQDYG
jgi:hypothetical protein